MNTTVRPLRPEDAPALMAIRREALEQAPLSFGSSPDDDRYRSLGSIRESLEGGGQRAVFGAFQEEGLIGIVGIVREMKLKERHKAQIGGMYVTPLARGAGAGRMLIDAAIEQARAWEGVSQIHLSVTAAAPAAERLYRQAGFRLWGIQPRSLQWEGTFTDESHLLLELGEASL